MPEPYKEVETRIMRAINALSHQEKPNIAKTAREFNVPESRLRNRWKGRNSYSTRQPSHRLLSQAQEMALCRYIDILDELDIHARPPMVEACANSILREAQVDKTLPPPRIGGHWLKRFFLRHPEYKIRKRRAIDLDRKQAHEPEVIQAWFNKLQQTIQQYGITKEDTYNFDETGFRIGMGNDQWIITREFKKPIWTGSNTNREYTTVVEAVNATGRFIKPFIIFSAKCILKGWFENAEYGSWIGVSDTGYINDQLAYRWIQHFHLSTRHTTGNYRLLICDGYGSHLTYEFIKYCEDKKIIIFFLIPHTSHILQPLDVGVFHAYKHWHSEAVADATQTGAGKLTKNEFLHALQNIRQKTFKERTIQHGFQLTGIIPFNPSIVLDNLDTALPTTPMSDGTVSETFSFGSTPKTVQRFNNISRNLAHLDRTSSDFTDNLRRLVKGSIAQAHLIEELRRDLEATNAAKEARAERSRASRHRIQTGGVVSSMDLDRIQYTEARAGNIRDILHWKAKWKKVMKELVDYALATGIIVRRQRRSRNATTDQNSV